MTSRKSVGKGKGKTKTHLPLLSALLRLDGEEPIKATLLLGRKTSLELVGTLANALLAVGRRASVALERCRNGGRERDVHWRRLVKEEGRRGLRETLVANEEVDQTFDVRRLPVQLHRARKGKTLAQGKGREGRSEKHLNVLGRLDLRRFEELLRLLPRPVFRRRVLTLPEVREDVLHRVVLLDQLQRRLRSDALDRLEVVATAKHAHVDELRVQIFSLVRGAEGGRDKHT
jgi:hypothetical protein